VLVVAVLLGGCATRLLDESDAGMSAADLGGCNVVPVGIDSMHGDDLNLCPSDLVRVTFRITIDACQPVRPALVSYDRAGNRYVVTAQVCDGPKCHGAPATVERTVALSETAAPSPGQLLVQDGAPGGTASVMLPIQNTVGSGMCGTVNGTGCRSDAECEASDPATRCWYDGSMCERICFDDTDCAPGRHCMLGFCG
jgi:hypothetical protein